MSWTIEQQIKRAAQGYGRGEGVDYRPWLGLRDVPSIGYRTRIKGRVVDRMHVFFGVSPPTRTP